MSAIEHPAVRPSVALPAQRARALTWPNAVSAFVLLVWFVPIRMYDFGTSVPYLEPYRVALVVLLLVALVLVALGGRVISAGGAGLALAAFLGAVLISQTVNSEVLDATGGDRNAMEGFFYLVTLVAPLVLVCSTIDDRAGLERVARAVVIGGTVVAIATFIESRTNYNVFAHFGDWIPGISYEGEPPQTRGGVPRVRASSQHPIALATALMLVVPLAIYLASRARTALRKAAWAGAAICLVLGSLVPVARTAVVMAAVMVVVGVALRGKAVLRYWPILVVGLALLHLARPGVMGALYDSFFPRGGLINEVSGRAGLAGSGRLADIDPGIELWESSPAFGIGRGNPLVGGRAPDSPVEGIIFDNQYMNALVTLGAIGVATFVWLLFAAARRLLRAATGPHGPEADLAAVCGVALVAFAAAIYFFDAFSFVQVMLLFFIVTGLGLRAASLPESGLYERELSRAP